MQLEQQETFEIKSPQLEVFGQVESKLPAPAKKRPFAAGFSAEYVRFQTGRNESLYDADRKGSLQSVTCERAVHRVTVPE